MIKVVLLVIAGWLLALCIMLAVGLLLKGGEWLQSIFSSLLQAGVL